MNSLSTYLSDLASSKILSHEEEFRSFSNIRSLEAALAQVLLGSPSFAQVLSEFADWAERPRPYAGAKAGEDEATATDGDAQEDPGRGIDPGLIRRLARQAASRAASPGLPKEIVLFLRDYPGCHGLLDKMVAAARASDSPEYLESLESAVDAVLEAKNSFAHSNLRLVVSIARKSRRGYMDLEELIQEGNIGLLRSMEKFDHERGIKFSTYSSWWIRQAINRAVIDKSTLVRLPVHVADMRGRVLREEGLHFTRTGEWMSREELSKKTGVTMDKLAAIKSNVKTTSLDAPVPGFEGDTPLVELMPGGDEDPDRSLNEEIYKKDVDFLFDGLSQMEKSVICWRFAIGYKDPLTLQEIANKYGLSRERIRQLEAQAIRKMRTRVSRYRVSDPFRGSDPSTGGR